MKEIQNTMIHIKFEFSALVHYVINYNLMENIDIDIPAVIQNVFNNNNNRFYFPSDETH